MRSATAACLVASLACVAAAAGAPDGMVSARLFTGGAEAIVEVKIAPGYHVNGPQPRDAFLIPTRVELEPPAGVRAGEVRYPEPIDRVLPFSGGKPMLLYEGTVRLTAPLEGTPGPGAGPLRAKLRYQACDDVRCYPPRTVELVASADAAAAPAPGGADDIAGRVARWGWGLTFLWVAALGVALNLTPCVYPLISVTVAYFGGRTGDGRTAVGHALCYVLGICLTFSTLGVAAALTGALFGAALQRPAVLGGIALLMVALALGNFGLYQLRMPSGVMRWAGRAGEGPLGAMFMGLTMGVVAAPCIGPVVVALLLYVGAQQSAALGFALFFTLGTGLGLPYVALALLAGRLRRLPRGGAWLAWMERLFGFVLLGIALHFATPLLPPAAVRFGWGALLVVAGAVLGFVGEVRHRPVRWARALAGLAVVAFGAGSLLVAEADGPIAWVPYSEQALAEAAAARRPAFVDFQAAWCLPCREMDQTTFRDPEVARAASEFVMLRADVTAQDERAEALMAEWRVPGVPTYVLLDAAGTERRRFVGYVPADEMAAAMRDVAGHG